MDARGEQKIARVNGDLVGGVVGEQKPSLWTLFAHFGAYRNSSFRFNQFVSQNYHRKYPHGGAEMATFDLPTILIRGESSLESNNSPKTTFIVI